MRKSTTSTSGKGRIQTDGAGNFRVYILRNAMDNRRSEWLGVILTFSAALEDSRSEWRRLADSRPSPSAKSRSIQGRCCASTGRM